MTGNLPTTDRRGPMFVGNDMRIVRWVNRHCYGHDETDVEGVDAHCAWFENDKGEPIAGVIFHSMRNMAPLGEEPVWDVEISVANTSLSAAVASNFRTFFEYAFVEMGYSRLTAEIADWNDRSIANARMLGFRLEGSKPRSYDRRRGNNYIYGLYPQYLPRWCRPAQFWTEKEKSMGGMKSRSIRKDNPDAMASEALKRKMAAAQQQHNQTEDEPAVSMAGGLGGATTPRTRSGGISNLG